ncbi:MAG: NUDIX domain-containing protein [Prolixibacteraceae bacterium]
MYKVFFNDSTIDFDFDVKKSLKNNIAEIEFIGDHDSVNQVFNVVESGEKSFNFFLKTPEVEMTWDYFRSKFVEIPAAGGLVQRDSGDLLFIKRLGVWDLPKGKIEKKETDELAAIREVEEECGLSGLKIIRQLDSTFHIYRSRWHEAPKNLVLKETKWFLMHYSGNKLPVPQLEEDIEEVRWISPSEMNKVLENTYLSLRDFLEKSKPFI